MTTDIKRLNANIPRELHKQFQMACIDRGEDMTAVLNKLIKMYVNLKKETTK